MIKRISLFIMAMMIVLSTTLVARVADNEALDFGSGKL